MSRNLATGGSAFGEISTRSSPTSAACSIASRVNITPRFSPFSSITLTFWDWMNWLNRGPDKTGGAIDRRGLGGGITLSPLTIGISLPAKPSHSENKGAPSESRHFPDQLWRTRVRRARVRPPAFARRGRRLSARQSGASYFIFERDPAAPPPR